MASPGGITDQRSAAGRAPDALSNHEDRDARPVRCSVRFYRPLDGRHFPNVPCAVISPLRNSTLTNRWGVREFSQ